uniref:Uncharacterized protein n=1 Tax=Chromera velia CCMP2878 TaxID=1169474 RepID=A0A0G4FMP7_9ALVE|eukprot:Cvel_17838.t1-p1 / transcript=Cvel_17838.t1 / gene=Cvel_17838 / organism=Chromera_velia_CCMP2878 / gene_product=hypothetical protein / transcript_product=hypothetical protein / location=Cvel_scaffold1446:15896-17473(-) / protein_length=361 / sequence_SO=supercontig / SO=protein_coding / is_pseudo=false
MKDEKNSAVGDVDFPANSPQYLLCRASRVGCPSLISHLLSFFPTWSLSQKIPARPEEQTKREGAGPEEIPLSITTDPFQDREWERAWHLPDRDTIPPPSADENRSVSVNSDWLWRSACKRSLGEGMLCAAALGGNIPLLHFIEQRDPGLIEKVSADEREVSSQGVPDLRALLSPSGTTRGDSLRGTSPLILCAVLSSNSVQVLLYLLSTFVCPYWKFLLCQCVWKWNGLPRREWRSSPLPLLELLSVSPGEPSLWKDFWVNVLARLGQLEDLRELEERHLLSLVEQPETGSESHNGRDPQGHAEQENPQGQQESGANGVGGQVQVGQRGGKGPPLKLTRTWNDSGGQIGVGCVSLPVSLGS